MKTLSKIYKLIKSYEKYKDLKWTKTGIFFYILGFMQILKYILSHPIYKILKYILNIIFVFEGIIFVIYFFDLPFSVLTLNNYTITDFIEFFKSFYTNVLKIIRDKINNLLDEKIVEQADNQEKVSLSDCKLESDKNNTPNYVKGLVIASIIIIGGAMFYYYYPTILNYFKDSDGSSDGSTEIRFTENISREIDDTPKASTSKLPQVQEDNFMFSLPKDNRPNVPVSPLKKVSNMNNPIGINPDWDQSDYERYFREP
jgi:hypothetical protein